MESEVTSSISLVRIETAWRTRPADVATADAAVTIWNTPHAQCEVESESGNDSTILTYACTPTNVQFWMGGKQVSNGCIAPRTLLVTGPSLRSRALFKEPWRAYRIYLPQSIIAECYEHAMGRAPATDVVMSDAKFVSDPEVEKLIQALVFSADEHDLFSRVYLNSVSLAVTARLMARLTGVRSSTREKGRLAKWRLTQVEDFIEANLDQPLGLGDLSAVAGLTRMHFAALFRASTGMTPHRYLLRRRISRAQELLLMKCNMPIVQIALEVGFQTQAHFTVVFRNVTGITPARWRDSMRPRSVDV